MTHGPENIALDFTIGTVKPIQHGFDFRSFGMTGRRAWIVKPGKALGLGESADAFFFNHCQWPDNGKSAVKKSLSRNHGTDLPGITDIEKKRFYQVVLVVPQGEFRTAQGIGNFEQPFAPQSRAEKAWVFPVVRTMGNDSMIGSIHNQGIAHLPAGLTQAVVESTLKAGVDINGKQFIMDRYPFATFRQCPQ